METCRWGLFSSAGLSNKSDCMYLDQIDLLSEKFLKKKSFYGIFLFDDCLEKALNVCGWTTHHASGTEHQSCFSGDVLGHHRVTKGIEFLFSE